jgi:hypothetical protein
MYLDVHYDFIYYCTNKCTCNYSFKTVALFQLALVLLAFVFFLGVFQIDFNEHIS